MKNILYFDGTMIVRGGIVEVKNKSFGIVDFTQTKIKRKPGKVLKNIKNDLKLDVIFSFYNIENIQSTIDVLNHVKKLMEGKINEFY